MLVRSLQDFFWVLQLLHGNRTWFGLTDTCHSNIFIHIPPIVLTYIAALANLCIQSNFIINIYLTKFNRYHKIKNARYCLLLTYAMVTLIFFIASFVWIIVIECERDSYRASRLYASVLSFILVALYLVVGILLAKALKQALQDTFPLIKRSVAFTVIIQIVN